ncbi:hypothetical protein HMPREF0972_01522 [Actinomyces sp. oral taxon 848 str. F0332]|nr:hypothetical protein HMPREF0972_01522 [Actinomyces sp. oral taxon 848 str. F0332]
MQVFGPHCRRSSRVTLTPTEQLLRPQRYKCWEGPFFGRRKSEIGFRGCPRGVAARNVGN